MNEEPNTLILLSPGFPANEADTTCLPAHQVFVRALNKTFPWLNIIIVAFQYPDIDGEYQWEGNRVISLNGGKPGKINRVLLWRKAWRTLRSLTRQYKIKGLLSFWISEGATVGKYFGKFYKIKHYGWITGQDAKKGNIYVKLMRPKVGEIFAMSDFLANQFYNSYGIKANIVIPNGIDVELFGKGNKKRDIDIFAAGSLIPLKQYDVFVEVVKLIAAELPGIQAVLCGKGPEESRLMDMITNLSLDDNIQLAGEKKHTEVLGLMQQSKVFLHTSNYEGFSTVCLEALYAGAHVVSFIKPMEKGIKNWHIAATKQEMAHMALEILLDATVVYKPVLAYSMDDIAKQVMTLY